MKENTCPICKKKIKYSKRYPLYICATCSQQAKTKDGRLLAFYNTGMSGGYIAYYKDSKEVYNSHICYIQNVKCIANEAYMGGIVIQRFTDIRNASTYK